jgi:hypothetical protein
MIGRSSTYAQVSGCKQGSGPTASFRASQSEMSRLARKPNYNFAKRSKEMARQAKKDAKREEKERRKAEADAEAPQAEQPPAQQTE